MKFYLLNSVIILSLISIFIPLIVEGIELLPPTIFTSFEELINAIINFIFVLSLGIAPVMIIIAGFYFITAAGNPEKIRVAKKMILYTLIGLLIIFCAKGFITFFMEVFGVEEETFLPTIKNLFG